MDSLGAILILIFVLFIMPQDENNSSEKKFKWQYKKWINGGGLMTKRNCNNCKFEPDWGTWKGEAYPRCSGYCKYPVVIPVLPSVYKLQHSIVTKYSDGSGTMECCPIWTRQIKCRKLQTKVIEKIDKLAMNAKE